MQSLPPLTSAQAVVSRPFSPKFLNPIPTCAGMSGVY